MKLFSYVCSQKIDTLTLFIWVMIPSLINVFVWCKVDITGYRYAVVQVSFVEENSFSCLMKSFSYLCLKSIESENHSVVSKSLQPHGLYSPWNSPGQNTGVGSLFLLRGDLSNPGIKPGSPTLQADSLPAEPPGKTN